MLTSSTTEADLAKAAENEQGWANRYRRADDVVRALHETPPRLLHLTGEGGGMAVTDAVELRLYRRDAETERDACGTGWLGSRKELKRAALAHANYLLEELAPTAAEANDQEAAAYERLKDATVELIAAAWLHADATLNERRVAQQLINTALAGYVGGSVDAVKLEVKREARYALPTRLSEVGIEESVERAGRSLASPADEGWWTGLRELVALGREKAGRNSRNDYVRAAVARYDEINNEVQA